MNSFWERICQALGMQDWIQDARFESIEKRRDNRRLVNDRVSEFTREKTVAELVELFTQHQVPHAPILGIKEALAQPQAVAREMVVETDHQVLGKIPIVGRAIKFPGDAQPIPTAPPVLGQHTDEILRHTLGLTSEQIEELRASKVIA
jgi:crotonobetainyl-CoA:carnitine CoA-transferase CaiB-like acyl-CoA transferase